jgi:GTP-binding protein HflX
VEKAILSDTVGFISDLPTQLVAAFRATLEEVLAADVIVHVRDMANPEREAQKEQVLGVLRDLGVFDGEGEGNEEAVPAMPIIEAWNKQDLLPPDEAEALAQRAQDDDEIVIVSALTGQGVDLLSEKLSDLLTQDARRYEVSLPVSDGKRIAWLHAHGRVLDESDSAPRGKDREPEREITVMLTPKQFGQFRQM